MASLEKEAFVVDWDLEVVISLVSVEIEDVLAPKVGKQNEVFWAPLT